MKFVVVCHYIHNGREIAGTTGAHHFVINSTINKIVYCMSNAVIWVQRSRWPKDTIRITISRHGSSIHSLAAEIKTLNRSEFKVVGE